MSKESISKTTRAVYFLGWEGAGVGIMSKGANGQSLQANGVDVIWGEGCYSENF